MVFPAVNDMKSKGITPPYLVTAANIACLSNTFISLNHKNISKYDKFILKNIIRRVSIQTIEQLRRGG